MNYLKKTFSVLYLYLPTVFNERSEGHLCLPKHYSFNVKEAVDAIMSGKFRKGI